MFAAPAPFFPVDGPGVLFVGKAGFLTASGAITWPDEAVAGDLAITFSAGSGYMSASGWTQIQGGQIYPTQFSCYLHKVLSAGDITSPPSFTLPTYGAMCCIVYRGPTTVELKSTTRNATGSSIVVAGFEKTADSKVVLGTVVDRDTQGPFAIPTGFSNRYSETSTYWSFEMHDLLANFYDEQSVDFDAWGGGAPAQASLLEIS